MINYSAIEAISPAIQRTKYFLFTPFRWGRFLKLTLVACLADGGMSSCNFRSGIPSKYPGDTPPNIHIPQLDLPAMPAIIGILIFASIIAIAFGILIAYLLIRLRFSYFECVLRLQDRIGPAWSRYHRQALRFLWLGILMGLGFWIVLILIGYGIYSHFKPLIQTIGSDHTPEIWAFLPLIGAALSALILLGLAFSLVTISLSNFVLPRMALEDASIEEALGEVWTDICEDPWQYVLFIVMRFLVSLAGSIMAIFALLVPVILGGIVALVGILLTKNASVGTRFLLGIPALALFVAFFILAGIGLTGMIATFRRNYGLLFYGSRYPLLGDILAPPAPAAPLPPWPGAMPSGSPGFTGPV
jgi:hypothetical protein